MKLHNERNMTFFIVDESGVAFFEWTLYIGGLLFK